LPAETVEQGRFGQEGLPTAATLKHFTVQTCKNETRERVSQASSEFSLDLIKKANRRTGSFIITKINYFLYSERMKSLLNK